MIRPLPPPSTRSLGLPLRLRRWGKLLLRGAGEVLGGSPTFYVDGQVHEYRAYWEAAARLIGADFLPLTETLWEVRLGGSRTRIANYVVAADDPVTLRLAGNKALCYRIAERLGVPVPEHRVFRRAELGEVREHVRRHPGVYVVKPAGGSSSGLGITACVRTPRRAEEAALLASLFSPEVIVERMVAGESYRLLYLDGELLHAVRRRGVRVVGDGRSTLRELLRARGGREAPRDPVTALTLRAQGLSPESVPEPGRSVLVRGLPEGESRMRELRTVYDETVTSFLSPELVRSLAAVVREVGSRFAGVDVVTPDPGAPLAESGGALLELNTTPGIHHHYHTREERRDHPVAVAVLRRLLDIHPFGAEERSPSMEAPVESVFTGRLRAADYLERIGVGRLPPRTSPFDPGYDPVTFIAHLEQSSHLMSTLKVSMACWLICKEGVTRRKVAAARRYGVPAVTGGGPFEIAAAQGELAAYLDLCADVGFTRIECGEGFTDLRLTPREVVRMVHARGMEAQFELGKKHGGAFSAGVVDALVEQGMRWLDAGAVQLVVEGRESAVGVGLFDDAGSFHASFADRFAEAFGLEAVLFEAPNKPSQFALLDHFGPEVHLCNVRLEEMLRVEIYRRGLHSDAFRNPKLRPRSGGVPVPGLFPEEAP